MALNDVQQLSATGVTPGSYTSANVTVDAAGRITAASSGGGGIPAGTVMSFFQAAAPTGWTQVTTQNNKGVRIVSGAGGGSGGTIPFTTLFSSSSTYTGSINITSGSVGSSTLAVSQMPSHNHTWFSGNFAGAGSIGSVTDNQVQRTTGINFEGGGGSHTHSLVGAQAGGNFTSNFAVQYIDMILASKN